MEVVALALSTVPQNCTYSGLYLPWPYLAPPTSPKQRGFLPVSGIQKGGTGAHLQASCSSKGYQGSVLTLTPMLVLGECETLIADTDIGALEILAGPVGQAQAWVLAALIYI